MACAQHLDDRLPWLEAAGVTPLLVSGACGERWPGRAHRRIPSIAPSGIRFELRHWLRRRISRLWLRKITGALVTLPCLPFYLLEKLILDLDSQWSWFPLAALSGLLLCRKHRPAVIYSTGGPASAHLAAAFVSRWSGIPWVAEFQDPLIYPDLRRGRRSKWLYRRLERLVAQRANRVVFLTNSACQSFTQRTGAAGKVSAVYPGADPDRVSHAPYHKGKVCRLAHFGSLAGSRNLQGFFQALDQVLRNHPGWREQVEIHLYGHTDRSTRDWLVQSPLAALIHNHGRRPRQEARTAMAQSDVLLLAHNMDTFSVGTIPFKLYEYLFAFRPIFALIYKNQELRTILQERGHFVAEAGDTLDIERGIGQIMDYWHDGFRRWQPAATPAFTVEEAVKHLIRTAQEAAGSSQQAAH